MNDAFACEFESSGAHSCSPRVRRLTPLHFAPLLQALQQADYSTPAPPPNPDLVPVIIDGKQAMVPRNISVLQVRSAPKFIVASHFVQRPPEDALPTTRGIMQIAAAGRGIGADAVGGASVCCSRLPRGSAEHPWA